MSSSMGPSRGRSSIGRASPCSSGPCKLEVFKRTERCAATNVDPETGKRDMAIPAALQRAWGHSDFGVYARVISDGMIAVGDPVTV